MERILIISTMYPSKEHPSFGIFIQNQAQTLKQRGMQVDVAAIKDPRMGKIFVLKKYLTWFVQILYMLIASGNKYDLVHAHYVFPSGLPALFLKKLFRTRMIVTAHGGDLDKMARKGSFYFKATGKILRNANHIIAVGQKLKSDMIKNFAVKEEKITLLNMGVNRRVFTPVAKEKARKMLQVNPESILLLYAGNLIEAKGLMELLEAYEALKETYPNVELHLIGDRKEPAFARSLEAKIKSEMIPDVTIHPAKGQQEIATWMAAADVFVIPSHMEGFGLAALEAMSCHTPVVGTNVGGLRYLLQDKGGVLVKPRNSTSLCMGIESVIQNKELQKEMIKNGEKRAQEYGEERIVDQLITIYHG